MECANASLLGAYTILCNDNRDSPKHSRPTTQEADVRLSMSVHFGMSVHLSMPRGWKEASEATWRHAYLQPEGHVPSCGACANPVVPTPVASHQHSKGAHGSEVQLWGQPGVMLPAAAADVSYGPGDVDT